jgi:hypothetical protein
MNGVTLTPVVKRTLVLLVAATLVVLVALATGLPGLGAGPEPYAPAGHESGPHGGP